MRTAGQGQAAVPRERSPRRRMYRLPERCTLVCGRTSPELSHSVERYHPDRDLYGRFCGNARFYVPNARSRAKLLGGKNK